MSYEGLNPDNEIYHERDRLMTRVDQLVKQRDEIQKESSRLVLERQALQFRCNELDTQVASLTALLIKHGVVCIDWTQCCTFCEVRLPHGVSFQHQPDCKLAELSKRAASPEQTE